MSDLLVDDTTGDITLTNGDLTMVVDADAIKQHITTRLRTFFQEWFLDSRRGIPYIQHILVKNPNPTVLDSIFKNAIIDTPGLIQITKFDIDLDKSTRELSVIFSADTENGPIDFTEALGVV